MINGTESCSPERIVLCVDPCAERQASRAPIQEGGKPHSAFSIIVKCAEAFILNKSAMNQNHQFSVLVYKHNVMTMSPFDCKIANNMKFLRSILPCPPSDQPTQLTTLLNFIYDKAVRNSDQEEIYPLRIILFYGRSGSCVLENNIFENNKSVLIDVLYVHKPILSGKERKRITSNWSELQSCLSEDSLCGVAVSDSFLAFKYVMKFLSHPDVRRKKLN